MILGNTKERYGPVAVCLHWLSVISVVGLFALGWWMVELDYYHDWYTRGPYWHKGLGVVFAVLLLLRMIWRGLNQQPKPLQENKCFNFVIHAVHLSLYTLLVLIVLSGYLIVTADGRAMSVFDWVDIPAVLTTIANQETLMGVWHRYLAYVLAALVLLHAAGALYHHFVKKDSTLRRMLGLKLNR